MLDLQAIAFALGIAACTSASSHPGPGKSVCDDATRAGRWFEAVVACNPFDAGTIPVKRRLNGALALVAMGEGPRAADVLEVERDGTRRLREDLVGPDRLRAAHMLGRMYAQSSEASHATRGHELLSRAVLGFAMARDYYHLATATCELSAVSLELQRLDAAHDLARTCVEIACAVSDPSHRHALLHRARFFRDVGQIEAAKADHLAAEALTGDDPYDVAWLRKEQGVVLVEIGTDEDTRAALRFLDAGLTAAAEARLAGDHVDDLEYSLRLNRAAALSALGEHAAALAEVDALKLLDRDHAAAAKIRGVAAAARGDLTAAMAHLDIASEEAATPDYAIHIEIALADVHERRGDLAAAERALLGAIRRVEALRGDARVELRPWILAHRNAAHGALVRLYESQGRDLDALAVIERLQARAWRESKAANGAAQPPLDGAAILEIVGDREVLVLADLGRSAWRAHVSRGVVEVTAIDAATIDAAVAFTSKPDDAHLARTVGDALWPRGSRDPRGISLVASGRFADVPFTALAPGGARLVDGPPVGRVPGLAAARCVAPTATGAPVFIADPAGDLRAAREEAEAIARAHGTTALVGADATYAALAAARDRGWVHLGVHGVGHEGSTALVLHDRRFTAADVAKTGLAPDVIVLAGCATADGADAERWTALPSAHLAAGTRYVIATTQTIDDGHARTVMEALYATSPALDPAERLTAAQRRAHADGVPVGSWARIAAWGVPGCDDALATSGR